MSLEIEIYKDKVSLYKEKIDIQINPEFQLVSLPTDIKVGKGLYTIKTTIYVEQEIDRVLHNGF